MKRITFMIIFICLIQFFRLYSDSGTDNKKSSNVISIVTWNAQTFFDSECEGTEYADYQKLGKWSRDKYMTRLSRLCEVMTTLNPDVFVLEEIENAGVVQDIANQLAGNSWDRNRNWNYACFAKQQNGAIGCAVFSRYELNNLRVHEMCIKSQNEEQPGVRPIVQVSVNVSGKELILLVNHWKSKSGGETESEIWRDWQESVLADVTGRLEQEKGTVACLMCGDFNRDAREFAGAFPEVELRGCVYRIKTLSPWFTDSGEFSSETGSYYYNGNWERIDHIFCVGNAKISAYGPRTNGVWCGTGGIPVAYKLFSGEGYSDHLPIMCAVTLF